MADQMGEKQAPNVDGDHVTDVTIDSELAGTRSDRW
jgi:hypothetical protein